MDKDTEILLDTIAKKAASVAVAKMREFHHDDIKVLGERIDIGFKSVNYRLDAVEQRLDGVEQRLDGVELKLDSHNVQFDRIENALAILLQEFKNHHEKQKQLESQILSLTERVAVLEKQLVQV